ncbi:N-acetyltransferase [Shewanella sp. OPT22]|nr:N-acetyltransferase [Shewanella sp. OPT22]
MDMEIKHEEDKSLFSDLVDGVRKYNFQKLGTEKSSPLSVTLKNNEGKIVAGVSGRTIYKQFLVEVLWADESHRGKGYGREVMEQAEVEAKKRGCITAQVDTLSIQAPAFYQKLGFEIVGKIPGVTEDHDRYFLMKAYTE